MLTFQFPVQPKVLFVWEGYTSNEYIIYLNIMFLEWLTLTSLVWSKPSWVCLLFPVSYIPIVYNKNGLISLTFSSCTIVRIASTTDDHSTMLWFLLQCQSQEWTNYIPFAAFITVMSWSQELINFRWFFLSSLQSESCHEHELILCRFLVSLQYFYLCHENGFIGGHFCFCYTLSKEED